MSRNHQPLTCVIDRIEGSEAVLIFEFSPNEKRELLLPKKYLPSRIKEGDILHLEIYHAKDAEERQRNLARKILDEILAGNS